ncbi:MAG: type IX secretion system outer membrane channel protein PorV [Bacteroidales bacterium]|nr:type IX secretion system outer membrane channel protein PorV [Bacteroidales bacterium]
MSNKLTRIKYLFIGLLLLRGTLMSYTQSGNDILGRDKINANPITTAVPFLMIGPDSHTGGMGEVGVALLNDLNAQHWNPAKYVFSPNIGGISVSYSPWLFGLGLNDIYLAYLSGYYKITDMDAVSMSLRFFSMGDMELMDYEGRNPLGDNVMVSPHEFSIDAAYSRKFTKELSMSVAGRFIYSNLTNVSGVSSTTEGIKPGLSGAADISLFYRKNLNAERLYKSILCFGLNFSNIGAKISYSSSLERDFLPANFRIGTAYTMYIDKYNSLTFALDFNKLLVPTPPKYATDSFGVIIRDPEGNAIIEAGKDPYKSSVVGAVFTSWYDAPDGFKEEMSEFIINVGLEYAYNDLLYIRAGYFNEAQTKGDRKYLTAGVGIKYSIFALDASYIIPVNQRNHALENTLRFTLSFDIGAMGLAKESL